MFLYTPLLKTLRWLGIEQVVNKFNWYNIIRNDKTQRTVLVCLLGEKLRFPVWNEASQKQRVVLYREMACLGRSALDFSGKTRFHFPASRYTNTSREYKIHEHEHVKTCLVENARDFSDTQCSLQAFNSGLSRENYTLFRIKARRGKHTHTQNEAV